MAILSHGDLETLWTAHGGDPLQANTAAAIAQAESGGNTTRINNTAYPNRPGYHAPASGNQPEYSVGLWQINLVAHPNYTATQMLTAAANAAAAVAIERARGNFSDWSTFNNNAYRPFLVSVPGGGPPAGGGEGGPLVPQAIHSIAGWHKLSLALGSSLPQSLTRSGQSRRAALRVLAQASKVGSRGR